MSCMPSKRRRARDRSTQVDATDGFRMSRAPPAAEVRPVLLAEILDRYGEAVVFRVVERERQGDEPAPREIEAARHHLEMEERARRGLGRDVAGCAVRAALEMHVHERTRAGHLRPE